MAVGYPVEAMIARAVEQLPAHGHAYEPKFDGARCIAHRAGGRGRLQSRQQRSLTSAFPELAAAVAELLPEGTVIDGELVVMTGDRVDFAALQRRLVGRPAQLANRLPARLVAFDLLAVAGQDLRGLPYRQRRDVLAELLDHTPGGALVLAPATEDLLGAHAWLTGHLDAGIEGVIAKHLDHAYRPRRRHWAKVKARATTEAVVGGVTGSLAEPRGLILGRPDAQGRLRIIGRSTTLSASARADLARVLAPPTRAHPWPAQIPAGRVGLAAGKSVSYLPVAPRVVVELDVDGAFEHGRFRHGARFRRIRAELQPSDLTPHR